MTEPRRLGSVLQVDDEGFLVPQASAEHVLPPWTAAVARLRSALVEQVGEALHSAYIRGSVAAGTAIAEVSDLDAVTVVSDERPDSDPAWSQSLQDEMRADFPFCTGIDLVLLPYDRVMARDGANRWGFILATQSVNIHGDDIRASLPRFRPGPLTVIHARRLRTDIEKVLQKVPHEESAGERKDRCAWIMRRIVRTGFELNMEGEGSWTRDLHACWEAFARHHPEHGADLYEALQLAVDPIDEVERIAAVLQGIGMWIADRGIEQYGTRGDR